MPTAPIDMLPFIEALQAEIAQGLRIRNLRSWTRNAYLGVARYPERFRERVSELASFMPKRLESAEDVAQARWVLEALERLLDPDAPRLSREHADAFHARLNEAWPTRVPPQLVHETYLALEGPGPFADAIMISIAPFTDQVSESTNEGLLLIMRTFKKLNTGSYLNPERRYLLAYETTRATLAYVMRPEAGATAFDGMSDRLPHMERAMLIDALLRDTTGPAGVRSR